MKETLERLWNEYLIDESSMIHTDEERRLTKTAIELHEKATALLSKEQEEAMEKYVDALGDITAVFARRAFCKGCEFTASFLSEVRNEEK